MQNDEEPNYKKLWRGWSDKDKTEFLQDLYKEQAEYALAAPPEPKPPAPPFKKPRKRGGNKR